MGPDGEHPALLFRTAEGETISNLKWSPDGRWLTYKRSSRGSGTKIVEARIPGSPRSARIFESADLEAFCWLSSGRIVLSLWEAPDQPASNLWDLAVDPNTMRTPGKPRRLTNWAGFALGHEGLSVSNDGRRMAITKELDQSDVFVGDLAGYGERLRNVRRLTSNDRVDWPGGWSPDSRWLLLQSDRGGHMGIFRLRRETGGGRNPEEIVSGRSDDRSPVFSPGGRWVIYLSWRGQAGTQKAGTLMRVPLGGGLPEPVLDTKGSLTYLTSSHVMIPTTGGHPTFRCPTRAGVACMLSEVQGNEIVFSSFEPVPAAARTEVFRVKAHNPDDVYWDLSPEGSRIAYGERGAHSLIRIQAIRADMNTNSEIPVPEWPDLYTIGWSADGTSLFATDFSPSGSSLIQILLDGKTRVLYKGAKELELPKASPDGRSLAFGEVVSSSNVWLIENLPF